MTESIMFGDGYRGLLFAALVPAMVFPILTLPPSTRILSFFGLRHS